MLIRRGNSKSRLSKKAYKEPYDTGMLYEKYEGRSHRINGNISTKTDVEGKMNGPTLTGIFDRK